MNQLLFLDGCVRGEQSRTLALARHFLARWQAQNPDWSVEQVDLAALELRPFSGAEVARRGEQERSGALDGPDFALARQFAAADRIVIAAPFWDMSYPAILKVFIENMSLFNITFRDNGTYFEGLCRCQKLLYITTRGMNVATGDTLDGATPYFKALSALWGLGEIITLAAANMDYYTPQQAEAKINATIAEGLKIAQTF